MGPQLDHELCTSELALKVLNNLQMRWPHPMDLVPGDLAVAADAATVLDLVVTMRMLCDNGYVMVEAVLVRHGMPMFREAAITQRGRAALAAISAADRG